jgi:crotonobetainyl-CoA:carnitine CoA-transferase CaiB-like acyl-CoA transferase
MLADLGADVVKVERPVAGDDTRHWGPPFLKDDAGNDTREASYFTACNRNKRSITVDMAHPEGQALLRAWRRGRCGGGELQDRRPAQYGLDYESLKALNPRLVYCSITGFGQDGPYAERAGYDLMVQAMCGLMSITGHADGEPGGGPLKVGVAVIDVFTGLYASNAILAALNARDNAAMAGEGQYIDMALLDVGMAVLANQAAGFLATGKAPGRAGNIHPSLAPYQDFPTLDGNVLLAIGNDGQFAASAPPSATPAGPRTHALPPTPPACRTARAADADDPADADARHPDWIALLEDKAVPCGPINTIAQAFDDPQVRRAASARSCRRRRTGHGGHGGQPMRLSAPRWLPQRAPPWASTPPRC